MDLKLELFGTFEERPHKSILNHKVQLGWRVRMCFPEWKWQGRGFSFKVKVKCLCDMHIKVCAGDAGRVCIQRAVGWVPGTWWRQTP